MKKSISIKELNEKLRYLELKYKTDFIEAHSGMNEIDDLEQLTMYDKLSVISDLTELLSEHIKL